MSCAARPARSAWPVAATPAAGGVGGAAPAGGGRPPAQHRPEQPPLERQPVVERELRDAGWLRQLIAWPTWPSGSDGGVEGACPQCGRCPLRYPNTEHRHHDPASSTTGRHQMRHPFITALLLRQAPTAAASDLSAGCRRPGAGSGQQGRAGPSSPPGSGPRPPRDQGDSMSSLTRRLVLGAMLVLSGVALASRSAGARRQLSSAYPQRRPPLRAGPDREIHPILVGLTE
jgi:hypothetical protein